MKNEKIDNRKLLQVFHLKHFDVLQHDGVMKIGTDSFLLGSLATVVPGKALDIGCGTGILALMIAQREPNLSNIIGIDISREAISLAGDNFQKSDWFDRLKAAHTRVQDFNTQDNNKFDLIISNPPFYKEGFLPADKLKRLNKHTVELSFTHLVMAVIRLLSNDGIFSTIIPAKFIAEFIELAAGKGLFLNRNVEVYSRPDRAAVRNVLEFVRVKPDEIVVEHLILRGKAGNSYTKDYLRLTKEFHQDVSRL